MKMECRRWLSHRKEAVVCILTCDLLLLKISKRLSLCMSASGESSELSESTASEQSPTSSEKSSESTASVTSEKSPTSSEAEWMTVYETSFFPEVGGNLEGNYYETYMEEDLSVFKVSRNWGTPWKVKRLPYVKQRIRQSPSCSADIFAPEGRIERLVPGLGHHESTSSSYVYAQAGNCFSFNL